MTVQINLVSRIDDDKNNFLDLVYIAYQLKLSGFSNFMINFIGGIYSLSIYQNIVRMADLLSVSDKISFTKKSIPLKDLSAEIKAGYFLNYTIGYFIGYSGLESINQNFKTLFLNGDKEVIQVKRKQGDIIPDLDSLISLIKALCIDASIIDNQIAESNQSLKKDFVLHTNEKNVLLSLLLSN